MSWSSEQHSKIHPERVSRTVESKVVSYAVVGCAEDARMGLPVHSIV